MKEWVRAVLAIALLVGMFALGMQFPDLCNQDSMDLHHHGLPLS